MTPTTASGSGFNKTVKVPAWAVTLVKISVPAAGVILAAYIGLRILQSDVDVLKQDTPRIKEKIDCLDREQLRIKLNCEKFEDKVGDGLGQINRNIEKMSNKMEELSTRQQSIQTDVRVIQQRIDKERP